MSASELSLQALQSQLMAHLLVGDETVDNAVENQPPLPTLARLSIYRNAYSARLAETMQTDHDILGQYLGDDWFNPLVQGYIDTHPSSFRSLRQFADALPDYLASTKPYADLPVLKDLASFERLLLTVFDAADANYSSLADLQALAPEQWPTLRLVLHPSVRLWRCQSNAVEIWQALKAEQAPPAAVVLNAQWLLWRGTGRLTEFRSLDEQGWALLEQVQAGADFSELCETLCQWHEPEQVAVVLVGQLQAWLGHGLVTALEVA